jgi:hypothetical protein
MRLAAIDIGSNAARLLISEVLMDDAGDPLIAKLHLCRVPLRLGIDVFSTGEISKPRIGMVLQTMKAYKHLMNAYGVDHMIACATSAMRDARNAKDIIRKIKMETGIDIEVISGSDEAAYIYESHIAEHIDKNGNFLYIDVGGGSTELTFFSKGRLAFKQSFNIGTIRLMIVLENPRAILRTHEIMDALHPYFVGASLGWHDYLASTARIFKEDGNYRIPVKADPNIVIKYIKASHSLLADVVGSRGGIKVGGMYGILPQNQEISSPSFQVAPSSVESCAVRWLRPVNL